MVHEIEERLEGKRHEHCAVHLAFGIAKLVLKAAAVAGAFYIAKEVHKVHKAIEHHDRKHLL